MLKTLSDATKYIIDSVSEIDPEEVLEEDAVHDTIEDMLFEKLEEFLTEKEVQEIRDHADDEAYIMSYIENKVPNYYTLLSEVTKELLADYLSE